MLRSTRKRSATKKAKSIAPSNSNSANSLPQPANEQVHHQVKTVDSAAISYIKLPKKRLYVEPSKLSTTHPVPLKKRGYIEPAITSAPYPPSNRQRIENLPNEEQASVDVQVKMLKCISPLIKENAPVETKLKLKIRIIPAIRNSGRAIKRRRRLISGSDEEINEKKKNRKEAKSNRKSKSGRDWQMELYKNCVRRNIFQFD